MEARRRTRRQRTQWVRQWLLRRPMYGQYKKLMHELTTKNQTSRLGGRSALQFGRRREYGRRGQSTDSGGGSTERVRSQYGLTLSAAYVKLEITFKIGRRIAVDRGGNPQTQYGYSIRA